MTDEYRQHSGDLDPWKIFDKEPEFRQESNHKSYPVETAFIEHQSGFFFLVYVLLNIDLVNGWIKPPVK